MKKVLIILLPLILIFFSCTEKPKEPKPEEKFVYTIVLTPTSGSAYINTDDTLTEQEVITLNVTIKKNGSVYMTPVQVTFQTQGALFAESLSNTFLAVSKDGKVTANLYSNYEGVVEVNVFLKVSDASNRPSAIGSYTFSSDPNLRIDSLSPNTGTTLGGDQITIYGNGFIFPLEVYIGGNQATYVSNTYTDIVVQTPSHYSSCCGCNDIVDVKVVVNPGQTEEKSYTLNKSFTYVFEATDPVITGIDPNHGTNNGGTLVTIYGDGFYCSEGILAYFNNAPAKVIECFPNKVIVEAPPAYDVGVENCNQTVTVRVLNICGGLDATLTGAFKYGPDLKITALSSTIGLIGGGDIVTIYGQGFDAPVAVTFAGVGAQVISVSNNEIVARTGSYYDPNCSDHSGNVTVTDVDCGISASCTGCWTYITPKLNISYITPTSGDFPGAISIYGFGFYPPFDILFGSSGALGYTYVDETQITGVGIPPFTGTYDTESCTDAFGCAGTRNINTPVDISVESLSTGCSDKFSSFFYIPPDTTCHAEAPTCSITSSVSDCTITYTASTVCGATYTWTDYSGGVCAQVGNTFTCTYASSGTKLVDVTITNTGGSATCGGSRTIEAGINPACP